MSILDRTEHSPSDPHWRWYGPRLDWDRSGEAADARRRAAAEAKKPAPVVEPSVTRQPVEERVQAASYDLGLPARLVRWIFKLQDGQKQIAPQVLFDRQAALETRFGAIEKQVSDLAALVTAKLSGKTFSDQFIIRELAAIRKQLSKE